MPRREVRWKLDGAEPHPGAVEHRPNVAGVARKRVLRDPDIPVVVDQQRWPIVRSGAERWEGARRQPAQYAPDRWASAFVPHRHHPLLDDRVDIGRSHPSGRVLLPNEKKLI